MLRPEPLDIVIIVLVAMLLFGANRLPESARSIGKAIREFKSAITGQEESQIQNPKPQVPKIEQKPSKSDDAKE